MLNYEYLIVSARKFSSPLKVVEVLLLGHKFFVRTFLNDLTPVEHMDATRVVYRLDSVGDHQTGFSLHYIIDLLLHSFLSLPVQGRRSLI